MEICNTQEELESRLIDEHASKKLKYAAAGSSLELSYVKSSLKERSLELSHEVLSADLNPQGIMHGGLICLMMDCNMGMLCRALTGDEAATTLDIHVNFLRMVELGKTLHTRAYVTRLGRKVISINGEAWTDDPERLCATACATFFRPTPVK